MPLILERNRYAVRNARDERIDGSVDHSLTQVPLAMVAPSRVVARTE